MIDETIGDYTIVKSLGKGGFGSVWKAKSADDADVALKLLNPQALGNKRVVKKFFHEAMILAKLDHQNICKLLEFFPDGENYAIVMEYVEGVELKQILKEANGLIPFDHAFKIARQTLSAFQYAHENGILHRDIKPANIMLDKHDNIKIMDFGIAKMSSTASHDTAASMLSIHYVPPERFDPSKEVDARSDIYSLGLVFYEMFAGKRPFMAEETSQIMFCHLNEIPQPPEEFVTGLPHEVSQAISKSLEKDPDDRFQDFREFSNAISIGQDVVDDATQMVDIDATQIVDQSLDMEAVRPGALVKPKKGLPLPLLITIAVVVIGLGIGGYIFYNNYLSVEKAGGPVTASIKSTAKTGGPKEIKGAVEEVPHPKDNSIMVHIPDGEFTMGSDQYDAERPVQQIFLDKYYIDKFLVTNKLFQRFVEETQYETDAEREGSGMVRIGRRWRKVAEATWKMPDGVTSIEGKEDHPVSQVTYNDALKYCQWAGKNLPTEAQWERAARGPEGNEFPWGSSEPDDTTANFDNLVESTTPVGDYEKGKSFYGIYDMAGNVYQWCKDWYGTGERQAKNPIGPETGEEHVIKGGSFAEGMESLRSANRDRYPPDRSMSIFGFRCACKEIK